MLDIAGRISASISIFNDPDRRWAPRDQSLTPADRIKIITDARFGVETWLSRSGSGFYSEHVIQSIERACYGVNIVTAHTSIVNWSADRLRKEIEIAARVGASILVVHPGTLGLEGEELPPSSQELRDIGKVAQDVGLWLALENSGRTGIKMMRRAVELLSPDPLGAGIGICIDTGHANRSRKRDGVPAETYLEEFRDLIIEVHVNDNLGDRDLHLPPGEGTVNWEAVIPAMHRLPDDAIICLEVAAPGDPVEVLRAAREFLLSKT